MLKWIILCINIIGVMAVVYYFLLQPIAPKEKALQPPPEFSFTDLSGQTHEMRDFKGKPTLIHFWASWCAPCVEEFPQLLALAKAQPRLQIIALSVDASEKAITKFIGKREVPKNFYIVWDKDKHITYDLFQTMNYPETILVGCDYTLRDKVIGMAADWPTTVAPLLTGCAPQTSDAPRPAPRRVAG